MSAKLFASLTCAALLAASAAYARSSEARPGEMTRETRQLGNKVTIDVYHRAPYALTGTTPATPRSARAGELKRETRQLGNKVTIDVYRR